MRTQRRPSATVTVVRTTTTRDALGNKTTSRVTTSVEGAIFEPERTLERTGDDRAPVIQPARWNLPGVYELDGDDTIEDGDNVWQVVGGSTVWLDRTEVPVTRTRKV